MPTHDENGLPVPVRLYCAGVAGILVRVSGGPLSPGFWSVRPKSQGIMVSPDRNNGPGLGFLVRQRINVRLQSADQNPRDFGPDVHISSFWHSYEYLGMLSSDDLDLAI